ncbi:MAG: alpha/beta fold hydrolase [Saprospiraceae bacterium]|nr:alpha/beta fold hydrolase [Saprospiraceae bacterium]MBK7810432.1 alpha/beta fold hydrolase [Saprospiraceae bacterium]MBK9630024.1 alpha/beta fold hydrolase [Saprospiraceae bacterium]
MAYEIQTEDRFKFIETRADGPTIVLLHGLFGALSNFKDLIDHFGDRYRVVVPILPIYELPITQVGLGGLVKYVYDFVRYKGLDQVHLLGNSLGGHVGLLYTLEDQERVKTLTLTGSSGLYESGMGNTFPKRGDYEFIKKKTQDTFYDPAVATAELIDEVFEIVNDRYKGIRIVATAKSAIRHNVGDRLHLIKVPVLLIWGKEDIVTPAFVGEKFQEMLPNAKLFFLEKCGHAPMMELPHEFNRIYDDFLKENS